MSKDNPGYRPYTLLDDWGIFEEVDDETGRNQIVVTGQWWNQERSCTIKRSVRRSLDSGDLGNLIHSAIVELKEFARNNELGPRVPPPPNNPDA